MTSYTTVEAVRLAVDPDWQPDAQSPTEDPAQDAAALSTAQIQDAIDEACGKIDAYLAARYQTPVAPVDPAADPLTWADGLLPKLARDIAAYLASLTYFRSAPMTATEPVYLRYQAAMQDLIAVRDGKAQLNLPASTSGDASDAAGGYAGVVDPGTGGLIDAADAGWHRGRVFNDPTPIEAPWVGWG